MKEHWKMMKDTSQGSSSQLTSKKTSALRYMGKIFMTTTCSSKELFMFSFNRISASQILWRWTHISIGVLKNGLLCLFMTEVMSSSPNAKLNFDKIMLTDRSPISATPPNKINKILALLCAVNNGTVQCFSHWRSLRSKFALLNESQRATLEHIRDCVVKLFYHMVHIITCGYNERLKISAPLKLLFSVMNSTGNTLGKCFS